MIIPTTKQLNRESDTPDDNDYYETFIPEKEYEDEDLDIIEPEFDDEE